MQSIETKAERVIVAKLELGEDLIEKVTQIVKNHEIKAGLVNIIGAFNKFTLGFFDLSKNDYNFKTFEEDVELLSCMGNIAYKNGEPMIHLHATIGREDYSVIGGHLSQPSIISVTGEVYIYEIAIQLNRTTDSKFGLSLLNL